jgi:hypothetical protein
MKRSGITKRLGYEASAGWTTYGTSLPAFSFFQGVASRHENSSENSRAVTTLVVTYVAFSLSV